jgi:RNA polymerase sigma-70 factor (ECF subfamily)
MLHAAGRLVSDQAMSTPPTTDAIWQRLGADLAQFIRRRVNDEHTADDLLQETFVRIQRGLDSLKDADRVAAWVYQIVRNVIAEHFRRPSSTPQSLAEEVAAEVDGTRDLVCRAGSWLGKMVDELPDTYRDAVRLGELEGLSQQEVADRLGISLSAAKQRVQRGREQLRQMLDRCCTFERDHRGNVFDYEPLPHRTVCRDCGD